LEFGAHTGFTLPEAVFEDGAMGTFLNHSEHKFESFEKLKEAHDRARKVGLKTLVFAADLSELKKILSQKKFRTRGSGSCSCI
jgi:triosephosphate isomerase